MNDLAPDPMPAPTRSRRSAGTDGVDRSPPPANVIAVASGKGGVGKTWLSITLAQALAGEGASCLLFDGDLGLANVDVQLGLNPKRDLGSAGLALDSLDKVVQAVDDTGFEVVAGRSGSGGLATMAPAQLESLGQAIRRFAGRYDRVVMDLGAGIDRPVRTLATHAGMSLVVTTDEPTALTDAYAYIKVIKQTRPEADLRVVVNMSANAREGERTYATLRRACENFLKVTPPLLGVVRRDDHVRESIRMQKPLLTRYPNAAAAEDVRALAQQLIGSG